MADEAKQRLVGALLVLSVIIIAAFFLVKNANNNVEEQSELVLPELESTIETVDDNIVIADHETLLDPHKLGYDVVATAKGQVNEKPTNIASSIKPSAKPIALEKVVAAKIAEPIKAKAPITKAVKPVKESAQAPPKAKVANTNQPQWLIQLASFGVQANAQALQKKVKTLGYSSTIQAIKNSQGKMIYRLRVGPESNKQRVDTIVSKVKQHLKLTPQVIKL
jgi:DedD protein